MADGGATYTVNIELATRQFSQDLRDLKNKIQRELGKSVKVATGGGTGANSTSRERALAIRKEQYDNREKRRIKYNADQTRAQLIEKQRLIERINKLQSFGYSDSQVKKLRDWAGEIDSLSRGNPQAAQQKIKDLRGALDLEDKILQTIINQGLEKEKQAKQQIEQSRKIENRRRKGPHGQRMHGPIDIYGNDIYDPGKRVPAIPKSGASLPIDLQRKGTGTFATSHTRLLRRRQNLETLLSTFEGISSPEIKNFKNGIQGLVKRYGAISTSMGQTKNASGFGNAGEIERQLKELDNLTHREEQRAKRIQVTNKQELDFLNQKHRIEKLLARFDKKGVNTTSKRLQLEKAITTQDKQQLDALLRQFEIENIGLKGVSGTGGGRGGRGGRKSSFVGGPSSPLNFAANGQLLAGPKSPAWGRIGQSAMISGGFPLLFGQSPAVAGLSAVGAGIGEAITPGGGFAGGIITSALASKVAEAIQFRKEIDKVNKSILAAGGSSVFTARDIQRLGKTLSMTKEEALNAAKSFAAFDASVRKSLLIAFGDEGTFNLVKGLKTNKQLITDIQAAEGKIGRSKADQLLNLIKTEGSLKVQKKLQDAILESQKKSVTGSKDQVNAFDEFMGMGRTLGNKYMNLFGQGPGKGNATVTGEDIKDIRMEKLLGTSQQDAVRKLGEELDRAFKLELITNIATVRDEIERMQTPLFRLTQTAQVVGDAFGESFRGIVSGSMSAQQALANLFQRTADMFLDMAAKMIAKQIQMKILGIGLNWFTGGAQANVGTGRDGTFGLGTHGSGIPTGAEGWGFSNRAKGGPVTGGSPYIVGEKGPELFVPGSSGNIVPNNAMGGTNIVVNVDASGSQVQGDEGQSAMLGRAISSAVTEEIARQKRPGGLLSAA